MRTPPRPRPAARPSPRPPSLFDESPEIETGILYRQDNLEKLAELPAASVDLIYLDPPFFSNRLYEVLWGDEAEVRSFEDRWEGGIQHYIGWMRDRVVEMHRVLKPTGSLYLHCDPNASHYLKVMLDGIFGAERFINEIVWKRTAVKGDARNRYGRIHDVMLVYARGATPVFHGTSTPHGDEYRARFRFDEHDGRGLYQDAPLDSPNPRPNLTYTYKGVAPPKNGWRVSIEEMQRLDAENRLIFPRRSGGRLRRKLYLSEQQGVPLGDVWTDIAPINSQARERLGYPTQKPESLLERVLMASSNPGDVVLDPFCGCGTTIAVADRLQRHWIGIDISPTAIEIMRRRLLKQGCSPTIGNAVDSVASLKALKPFEFQNWIINAVNGELSPRHVHDMGIDGFWFFTRDPVQVKQSEHVGRNVVDNFETAIRRAGHTTGYIIAFSFTRGAAEEVARARSEGLDIKLVKVTEVLLQVKRPSGKLGPQPGTVEELPLPPMRKPKDMPTAEELVESDRRAATA